VGNSPCDSKGLDAKGTAGWSERAAAIRGVTDEGACTRADKWSKETRIFSNDLLSLNTHSQSTGTGVLEEVFCLWLGLHESLYCTKYCTKKFYFGKKNTQQANIFISKS